ncbi:MAG: FG-GAP-like repeat-containing protein [Saprospiraceae bacterium]|nr:FG-GAP-like repeat-containing protein [Saprospiraceae bacterium]
MPYVDFRRKIRIKTLVTSVLLGGVLSCFAQEVTFEYRPGLLNPVSGFTAFAECAVDMDGDGRDDVVRIGSKGLYIDYQRTGGFDQTFHPISFSVLPVWSICAGDLDNNGFTDLLFADTEQVSFVFASQAGTSFTEAVMPVALISQRSTMVDIDNDGLLDAFVCNDTSTSVPFRNLGAGTMLPDTTLIRTSPLPGAYSAIWTDLDQDGDSDLYISKCLSGAPPDHPARANLLYRNEGNGQFAEVGAAAGVRDFAQSWSTVSADFDNDGDMDLFVVNHDMQNRLYRNNGNGTFTDVIEDSGIDPFDLGAFECLGADFNNDGYVDIYAELVSGLYLGNGDLTFEAQSTPVSPGAIADLNNDGFLDITRSGQAWLNNGNDHHWFKVIPMGIESNADGIGARIELFGPGGIQVREIRSGESYSMMNTLSAHFGLGTHLQADSVRIIWPSGMRTLLTEIAADTSYMIPEAECIGSVMSEPVIEVCTGDTLVLAAPEGYFAYRWSNGDTTRSIMVSNPGQYRVILTDKAGCRSVQTHAVVLRETAAPQILAHPGRRVCSGESVALSTEDNTSVLWTNGTAGTMAEIDQPGMYAASTVAVCTGDTLRSTTVHVAVLAADPVTDVEVQVNADQSAMLSASGDVCYWYDREAGGTLLHVGCDDFVTGPLEGDTIFYVENQRTFPGENVTGGLPDTISGGVSTQTGFVHFTLWEPATLVSVRVYVPGEVPAGVRFIQLISGDTLLAVRQFDVVHGWNVLELDMAIPAGSHALLCPQGNLYREKGVIDYPLPLGAAGEMTGTSFGDSYYYYFYDWQVRTSDVTCAAERIAVPVSTTRVDDASMTSVSVFPNPVHDHMTVQIPDAWSRMTVDVRLRDLSGREVKPMSIQQNLTMITMDAKHLAPGTYLLEVLGRQEIARQMIVVQ